MPDQTRSDASLPTMVSDLWELIRTYAKQETVGPLKGLGRSIALGLAGSVLVATGLVLVTLAGLRALQSQTGSTFEGSWSFAPYLLTLVGVAVLIALALGATRKRSTRKAAR